MKSPSDKPTEPHSPVKPDPSFPSLARHGALTVLTLLCFAASLSHAAELGALVRRELWHTLPFKYSPFNEGGAGIVTDSAADGSLSGHASASFHTLAVRFSIAGAPPSLNSPSTYPEAYWFEQITISSPSVANGTIGTADFTLFFEGNLSLGPPPPNPFSYYAEIGYQVNGRSTGADGQPDLNGTLITRRITEYGGLVQAEGTIFWGQPRNHQVTFRFGQPFDFTISIQARGRVHNRDRSSSNASLRLKGWNGFQNIRIRDGAATPDAVVGSQTSFNYGNAGTTSFEQWASSFQVGATSANEDTNQNGVPNLLEYALGRDPRATGGGNLVIPGSVMDQGVNYPTISFTRPALGARPGDIQYTPERSSTLQAGGWSDSGMVIDTVPNGSQSETVTVRSTVPLSSPTSEFLRLKVTTP